MLTSFLFAPPSNGTPLLKGYVSQNDHAYHTTYGAIIERQDSINSDSYPSSYEGTWHCQTEVIASSASCISIGQQMSCAVRFQRHKSGEISAVWQQPGWQEAKSSIAACGPHEAITKRTNFYLGNGSNRSWTACCHDHFKQLSANAMVSSSYVDQYMDGHYLGRYQTRSVLYRVGS